MENLYKGASAHTFKYARANRQKQTHAEQLLWMKIRNRKLKDFKFRRQHPISDFIPDFYCHQCRLAVEIDGGYHTYEEQKEYDFGRTYEIREMGIKIVRFSNREVEDDVDNVLEEIKKYLC